MVRITPDRPPVSAPSRFKRSARRSGWSATRLVPLLEDAQALEEGALDDDLATYASDPLGGCLHAVHLRPSASAGPRWARGPDCAGTQLHRCRRAPTRREPQTAL